MILKELNKDENEDNEKHHSKKFHHLVTLSKQAV
jgi:hypothetical protein